MNDLRYAVRMLLKYSVSNLAIILTIAVLVGLFSAPFAFIRALDRMKHPYPEPERLVQVWHVSRNGFDDMLPMDLFHEIRDRASSLESIGAICAFGESTCKTPSGPVPVLIGHASAGIFRVTGMAPHLGRYFTLDEERAKSPEVAVISHRFWRDQLGGDPEILGRVLQLEEASYAVVGVLPAELDHGFVTVGGCEILVPHSFPPNQVGTKGTRPFIHVVARVKKEVSVAAAQEQLAVLGAALEKRRLPTEVERKESPEGHSGIRAVPENGRINSRGSFSAPEHVASMQSLVRVLAACVVLLAMSNIITLLMARVASRAREIGVRLSLGASRWQVIRQLIWETMLPGILGGWLGMILATLLVVAMPGIPDFIRPKAGFDVTVLFVTTAAGLGLALLVGLLPAWQGTTADLSNLIRTGSSSQSGAARHRLRNSLIAFQCMLALVLCLDAGLLFRSQLRARAIKPGFVAERMLTAGVHVKKLPVRSKEEMLLAARQARETALAMPGVRDAALIVGSGLFPYPQPGSVDISASAGNSARPGTAMVRYVSPGYLSLTGTVLKSGRFLSPETRGPAPEAVVDATFARRNFESVDPVGRQIRLAVDGPWLQIVGVVEDRIALLERERFGQKVGEVFVDFGNVAGSFRFYEVLISTTGTATPLIEAVRGALQRLDPDQPKPTAAVVAEVIEKDGEGTREFFWGLSLVACGGLFLALLGIYATVAHAVVERTREAGIRAALGATRRQVTGLLVMEGFRLPLLGLVPGLLFGCLIIRGLPETMLSQSDRLDLLTISFIVLLFLLATFLASWWPATRAAAIDPVAALRND